LSKYSIIDFWGEKSNDWTGIHTSRTLLEHGFLRVKCDGCRHEHLVAFSCPSCGARRMVESADHLVDHVFPEAPVRQRRLSQYGGLRACEQEALPACRSARVAEPYGSSPASKTHR
jgi:hypothetical protein